MSSFACPKCGADIIDTPRGYVTGCDHFPLEQRKRVHIEPEIWQKLLIEYRRTKNARREYEL